MAIVWWWFWCVSVATWCPLSVVSSFPIITRRSPFLLHRNTNINILPSILEKEYEQKKKKKLVVAHHLKLFHNNENDDQPISMSSSSSLLGDMNSYINVTKWQNIFLERRHGLCFFVVTMTTLFFPVFTISNSYSMNDNTPFSLSTTTSTQSIISAVPTAAVRAAASVDPLQIREMLNSDDKNIQKEGELLLKARNDKYSRIMKKSQTSKQHKNNNNKKEKKMTTQEEEEDREINPYDLLGLGISLVRETINDDRGRLLSVVRVSSPPLRGSSAEAAGLKAGDIITNINGMRLTSSSSSSSSSTPTLYDIVDRISDAAASIDGTVKLTVQRNNGKQQKQQTMTLPRDFRGVSPPLGYKISERRDDGTIVAYIRIFSFNSLTVPSLRKALITLSQKQQQQQQQSNMDGTIGGANAFVIDLRHNKGGIFQSAIGAASLFLDDRVAVLVTENSPLTTTKPNNNNNNNNNNDQSTVFRTKKGRVILDPTIPIVLWIDNQTASASEIFVGALRDNCRAFVMGRTSSFGKGLIQGVVGLDNGDSMVITVARYQTPLGKEIQNVGIQPDNHDDDLLPLGVGGWIPGVRTDTSMVDFRKTQSTLSSSCPPSI